MVEHVSRLSEFIAGFRFEQLPETVCEQARLVTADTLAVIAAGSAEPEMQALTGRLRQGAERGASVLGTGRRADAATAAFLNATAGTFLELDEGNRYARGHPAIHVLPAALAFSEVSALSGKDFLLALVLGYETGARIGIGSILRPGVHPHGTWGTVAAAVSVASLAGADAEEMREVINTASPLGLANSDRTMLEGATVRNAYAGFSAQTGLMVWDLVRSGFRGARDGLSSVWGEVLSESWDPSALTEALGERWEISRNYFKRHACCRFNHAALDVLAELRAARYFSAADVRSLEVETYAAAARLDNKAPQNTLAAKFSVPFALATVLVHADSGTESFSADAVRDEEVRALAARTTVREDPLMSAMLPALRPARVTVSLKSGEQLTGYTETNRGDTEDPYHRDQLAEKFFELSARVWPRAVAEELHESLMTLERVSDVNALTRIIRRQRRVDSAPL